MNRFTEEAFKTLGRIDQLLQDGVELPLSDADLVSMIHVAMVEFNFVMSEEKEKRHSDSDNLLLKKAGE